MKLNITKRVCVLLASCLLSTAVASSASPVPVLTLKDLVSRSDAIVLGRSVSTGEVSQTAEVPSASTRIVIKVLTVLKGDLDGEQVAVTVDSRDSESSAAVLDSPLRIFFLTRRSTIYEFTSKYYKFLPATGNVNFVSDDPLGRVIESQRSVIQSQLELSYREMAVYALGNCRDPRALLALSESLGTTSTSSLRMEIVSQLAALGDAQGILLASQTLASPPTDLPPYIVHNLAVGIRDAARDESYIPNLRKMLGAKEPETREAAAEALRKIGTSSVVNLLSGLLSDEDRAVRFQAVVGLSEISKDPDHRPNLIDFGRDDTPYVQYWRDWSAKRH